MSDWNVPAALVAKWMHSAKDDPAIKPVRVIYATPATKEEVAELRAERREKERRHVTRVKSSSSCSFIITLPFSRRGAGGGDR